MSWEENEDALAAFDELILNSWDDLNEFMEVTIAYGLLGETPPELLLRLVGKFWYHYVSHRKVLSPIDSLTLTKAMMMSEPILHHLVQVNGGKIVTRVVEDEE